MRGFIKPANNLTQMNDIDVAKDMSFLEIDVLHLFDDRDYRDSFGSQNEVSELRNYI